MATTKYSHLTDAELLGMVEERRSKSSIIQELCQRLEAQAQERELERERIPPCCPVCEATLVIPPVAD